MFYLSFFKFASILHAYYKKSQEIFSLCTNFEIFQKFSVKIKIFLHILIVPIMYECRKLKKAIGNKILFPVILEQCDFQLIQNNSTPWMKRTRCYLIQIHAPQMYKNVNSPLKKDFTQLCFHGWSRKLPLKMEASLLLYTASSTKLQIIIIVKILQSGVCSMYLLSSLLA